VSTADQNPQLQLDALANETCLKIYIDRASGTKAERPQWHLCLADLRAGDTLIIWRIDRLGRNLRDLIDIVTTLQARVVGVRSLSNGIVDTTTAHGALVFGMFALMAEYEATLIRERTQAGLAAARARGRTGGRKPKMTPELINKAQRMYDARQFTMAEIAASCAVTPMTIHRNIRTGEALTPWVQLLSASFHKIVAREPSSTGSTGDGGALHPRHHRRVRPGRRADTRCRTGRRQIPGTPTHPAPLVVERFHNREATSAVTSTSRFEKAHSLSYQPTILTWLPITLVRPASKTQDAGSVTMSQETMGSSV
jgi:DNA invertase Pin-like site-specific DNA recombinase